MTPVSRHLEVIYCDDIREEVGNKISYMGVYWGELWVQAAPVTLAKLCIAIKVVTDIADPFEALEVRIVKGEKEDDLLSTGPIPAPTQPTISDNNATRIIVQMVFILAPFQIEEETVIRVKAKTEREELSSMALRIRIGTQATPSTQTIQ